MYALKLIVIATLVCCVLSETEFQKLSRRYCGKDCNNVEVTHCGDTRLPKVITFYKACSSANRKDLKTLEQINKYYCEEATEEECMAESGC